MGKAARPSQLNCVFSRLRAMLHPASLYPCRTSLIRERPLLSDSGYLLEEPSAGNLHARIRGGKVE
jgi:hypothetical protein